MSESTRINGSSLNSARSGRTGGRSRWVVALLAVPAAERRWAIPHASSRGRRGISLHKPRSSGSTGHERPKPRPASMEARPSDLGGRANKSR